MVVAMSGPLWGPMLVSQSDTWSLQAFRLGTAQHIQSVLHQHIHKMHSPVERKGGVYGDDYDASGVDDDVVEQRVQPSYSPHSSPWSCPFVYPSQD